MLMDGNMEVKTWPMLLDMNKDECKKALRSLELSTYSKIVSVLRAQGELTKEKRKLLSELQSVFSISVERHRAEIRRAVNDEVLNTIAERLAGPNTTTDWAIEGRRLIPLMPRVPPQVSYTALATRMAQLYCAINSQMPNPRDTAMYGKLDDVAADFEMTDSEDETDGLRYITESMIPQQFNADQGPFTALPLSQARLAKEKLKEKKENGEEVNHDGGALPSPPLSSSMSSGSVGSAGSQGRPPPLPPLTGAEKRKRKRSPSVDHPPPHSPPPPPTPLTASQILALGGGSAPFPQGSHLQGGSMASMRQLPSIGPTLSSSMKITVTGGMTRSTSALPINSNSQQKVILVSTSAASGSVGSIYQRSISVPILKSSSAVAATISSIQGSQSGILKGPLPTSTSGVDRYLDTTVAGLDIAPPTSVVNKIRPRFASTISSQGSSSLPGLSTRSLQRPRSNSLILQHETHPASAPTFVESSLPKSSSNSIVGQTLPSLDPTVGGNSLSLIGSNTVQLRPGASATPKNNIHVKQDAGKLISHTPIVSSAASASHANNTTTVPLMSTTNTTGSVPGVVGGRIIGRASLPAASPQGLYVVSTSSGTITVVTRTVASASISNSRVVTVNTINSSRSSIVRGPTPSTVVSVGMNQKTLPTMRPAGSIRPVMSGSKSNVIVVHKGTIASGSRSVGIQGLRDLSAKIITKPSSGVPGAGTGASSGILSGTLVVKPSPATTKSLSSMISSTKDTSLSISTTSVSSTVNTNTAAASAVGHNASLNNLIVVDLSSETTGTSQSSSTTALANILHTPCVTPSSLAKGTAPASFCSTGSKPLLETVPHSIQLRKETHVTVASSSHDISTVSASSSLPSSFRGAFKSPLLGASSGRGAEMEPESSVLSEEQEEEPLPLSNLVSSSSDAKTALQALAEERSPQDLAKEERRRNQAARGAKLAIGEQEEDEEEEDEEEEEDNEWLKLGLEDEEEMELEEEEEEEEEERTSEVSSGTEKSGLIAEDSLENEADVGEDAHKNSAEEDEAKKLPPKAGCSEESVSSSTGPANEKEELQMLVEKAVEVLKGGDSDQARSLLYKAGFELIESSADPDQREGEGFSISNIAGVSSSSALLGSAVPLSASTPLRDESSLGSMSELDPATGYFYSPAGENSSEPTSNKADSPPTSKEDDPLTGEADISSPPLPEPADY